MSYFFSVRNLAVFWFLFAVVGGAMFAAYSKAAANLDASALNDQAVAYGLLTALSIFWAYLLAAKQEAVYGFHKSYEEDLDSLYWLPSHTRPAFVVMTAPFIALGLIYVPTITAALCFMLAVGLSVPVVARTWAISGTFGAKESEIVFNYMLMAIIAAYIPLQLWFNAAMINTIASDENLIYNHLVTNASLLFAAIGITIHVVRAVGRPAKDERFSIFRILALPVQFPLLILRNIGIKLTMISPDRYFGWRAIIFFMVVGTGIMFYGVQGAVSLWAGQQTASSKSAALIGLLGRTAIINQFGVPGESDEFKTPERVRLELLYMPAVFAMSDTGDLSQLRSLVSNSSYVRETFNSVHVIPATREGFADAKRDLQKAWDSYSNYLQLVGVRMPNEAAAARLIEPLVAGQDRLGRSNFIATRPSMFSVSRTHYNESNPLNVRTQNGFTCNAKADFIMDAVVSAANARTRDRYNFTRNSMGTIMARGAARSAVRRSLAEHGVWIPAGWSYTNNADMLRMISNGVCRTAEDQVERFQALTGVTVPANPNASNVLSLEQYMQRVTGVAITDVESLDFNGFQDLISSSLRGMSSSRLLQEATNRVSSYGDDWIRAAIMPVVGVTSSLLVMIFNLGYLIYKVLLVGALHLNSKKWKSQEFSKSASKALGGIVAVCMILTVIFVSDVHKLGLAGGFMKTQEAVYRLSNYHLSKMGYAPSLSVQSNAYKQDMAEHHLSAARAALQANRLATPPSRSVLFHVMMAKYHWPQADTNQIMDAVIDRYKALGAENAESSLNDRLQYIQHWNEIYRLN